MNIIKNSKQPARYCRRYWYKCTCKQLLYARGHESELFAVLACICGQYQRGRDYISYDVVCPPLKHLDENR